MNYKHSCVIDNVGAYKTLVLVLLNSDTAEHQNESVQFYTLGEKEQLVDTSPPSSRPYAGADGFISPRWNGSKWIESATGEEIDQWEAANPAPVSPEPTESLTLKELSIAQARQKAVSDQAVAELSILIANLMAGGMMNV